MRKNLLASFMGIIFAVVILETCCQIYSLYLDRQWKTIKEDPDHYYKASHNVLLGYELSDNFSIENDHRRLWINRFGIRELDNQVHDIHKIAILGDSIVFGNVLSQEQTISALLQQSLSRIGASVSILNFGVPGYGLKELLEYLKIKDNIYNVDHVIYILNPNDFARRNSIYEGADAGLYRMYNQPLLKSPWFIRKAIYRIKKYSGLDDYHKNKASIGWYQWLFNGNKDAGYNYIKEMALYANEKGCSFTVVLLPAGVAYNDDGTYELSYINANIGAFLKANNISYINPTDIFRSDVEKYFDPTDHLTFDGNALMAEILHKHLEMSDKEISSTY